MKKIASLLLGLSCISLLASCGSSFKEGDTFTFESLVTSKGTSETSQFYSDIASSRETITDFEFNSFNDDAGFYSVMKKNYGGIIIASHYTDPLNFYSWRWATSPADHVIGGLKEDGSFTDSYCKADSYKKDHWATKNWYTASLVVEFKKIDKSAKKIDGTATFIISVSSDEISKSSVNLTLNF